MRRGETGEGRKNVGVVNRFVWKKRFCFCRTVRIPEENGILPLRLLICCYRTWASLLDVAKRSFRIIIRGYDQPRGIPVTQSPGVDFKKNSGRECDRIVNQERDGFNTVGNLFFK